MNDDAEQIRLHVWACQALGLPVISIPLKPTAKLRLAIRHALNLIGAPYA